MPIEGLAPEPEPGSRARGPVRRALFLTPILAIFVGLAVVGANLPREGVVAPSNGTSSGAPAPEVSSGYLVSHEELRRRGGLAAAGEEPFATAVTDLMDWAKRALDDVSRPTQPLVIKGTDNAFVDDARRAYGLGLAYQLSGDEQYAESAAQGIRDWMNVAVTTGDDTCPDSGGCHTSLIVGRAGAGFVFGADLIAESAAWTEADRTDLQEWMRRVILPAASERPNNWGDAGTLVRIVAADYAGERAEFDRAIDTWRSFIDLIEPDGRIPEEVRRGSAGISYTQEALQYKVAVARIAEQRGIDLWDYVGARGGSLRKAIDRLADYWHRPEDWPDHPQPRVPSTGPMWEIAYAHWEDPRWVGIMLDGRPYGDRGHSAVRWTTLTNGIPVGTDQASPLPTVPARPTRPPSAEPTLASPSTLGEISGLAVTLRSALSDPVGISITWDEPADTNASVELERSVAGGGWSALALGSDGQSARDSLQPNSVVAYRVRAVVAGVSGPWTTLEDVSVARFEATARTVDLSGPWERVSFDGYSAGSALSTDARGSKVTWRGTTQAVAIIGPTGPTRGRLIIDVDGVRADDISLRTNEFQARNVLFTMSWSVAAAHEIVIEARPSSGRRTVAIDDIVTLTSTLSGPQGS